MSVDPILKKKKVLFLIPEFPVMSETFIEQEVAEIDRRGNLDVKVFSFKGSDGFISENIKNKVVYKKINLLEFYAVLISLIKFYGGFMNALYTVQQFKGTILSKIFLLGKALGYSYFISRLKPDHLHIHFLSEASTIGMVIAVILDTPFSISGHAIDIFVEAQEVKSKADKAKFIRVCNKNAWNKCREESGKENLDKILLQHHGISFENKLSVVKEKKKTLDHPILFNVGRYYEKKGQEYLIKAAKLVNDSGKDFILNMAGGGHLYNELEQFIKVNLLEDKVKLLGTKDKMTKFETVMEHFSVSDIFILPSIEAESGDVDGIPNTILEAAAFKLPVISTKAGSIEEVIIDGETGLFVEQKDPQDLADKIIYLMDNPKEASRLGENLHNFVKDNFGFKKCMDQFEYTLLEHT